MANSGSSYWDKRTKNTIKNLEKQTNQKVMPTVKKRAMPLKPKIAYKGGIA